MGGPTPYEPLPAVFSPPQGTGVACNKSSIPLGAMGAMGQGPEKVCWSGAVSMNAQGPWPPAGGGKTLARRLCRGGSVSPLPVPYVCPSQDGPPILGVLRRAFYYRFLPIFRTFLGDLVGRFVVLEFYSHDYLSTRLFFFRIRFFYSEGV